MILGVGTDVVNLERIAHAMENPRFTERVFTPIEREGIFKLCSERQTEHAAGLFAAKEAVAKAFGTGFKGFGFSDIEIRPDANGRPEVFLHERAHRSGHVHLSIAHDAGIAVAFAVWEENDTDIKERSL